MDPIIIPVVWDQQALSGEFISSLVGVATDVSAASGKDGIPTIDRQAIIDRLWNVARGIKPPGVGSEDAANSWIKNRSLVLSVDAAGMHVSTQES